MRREMITRLDEMTTPFKSLFKLPKGWDIRFSPRFIAYVPTYKMSIETKNYSLETASTMSDLLEVFELRHQIFLGEIGAAKKEDDGFDVDEFDSVCDHIIIRSKETGNIVGTYRVISSLYSDHFYSQTEFSLEKFLNCPGHKLELGRACIHRAHRNGAVIDLLWRGIAEYIKLTGSQYLFGCSSIKIMLPSEAKSILHSFEGEGNASDDFEIRPVGKFDMKMESVEASGLSPLEVKKLIPPLLRSYFSAGAKVYGLPALDRDFHCIDFLTILNCKELTSSYKRRYFKD